MYAIVEIAGKQFRVKKDDKVKVPLLSADAGSKVEFDRVLFFQDDKGKNEFGQPMIDGFKVSATVVEHGRDKKIIVFKKKRRKGYQKKNGHRQDFSVIKIEGLGAAKKTKKAEPKTEAQNADAVKEAPNKPAPKKAVKKDETKKETPKKETAKKTAVKKEVKTEKKEAAPKENKAAAPKKKTEKPAEDKEA